MRSEVEVLEFERETRLVLVNNCRRCDGSDAYCECHKRCNLLVRLYEAGVPREFWEVIPENIRSFAGYRERVLPYMGRLKRALRSGYGLCFTGRPGSGKTMLLSAVLRRAVERGRTTCYLRASELEKHIRDGWKEPAIARRLDWLLTSDFVALDDLGTEQYPQYVDELLKNRGSELSPTLLGTRLGLSELGQRYSDSTMSVLSGRYAILALQTRDGRVNEHKTMDKAMGYVGGTPQGKGRRVK